MQQISVTYNQFFDYAFNILQHPYSIWLDSADLIHPNSRYSYVLTNPFEKIHSSIQHDLFDFLKEHPLFNQPNQHINASLPPFTGGFAGFIGYDYTVQDQFGLTPPPSLIQIPEFYGGLYDTVLYADHKTQTAGIIAQNIHPYEKPKHRIEAILDNCDKVKWCDIQAKIYQQNVSKVIDYIQKGDIFQANIAHYIKAKRSADFNPLQFYKHLRKINPVPFGCFINDHDFQILSCSPERFLKIDNHKITAEPIKGTAKSHPDPKINEQIKSELARCPKNRAENIMIVDLLRNDITKHSIAGSIKVNKLCELHSFRNLHHLISTISADMKPDAHMIDVIRTALPGGSITGAPKKRVCEIIYELEKAKRHAYCGSAGYIGFNGQSDMNILIRTIQADKNNMVIHSGCGITAQSDPISEFKESETKIQKILESFETAYVSDH